MSARSTIVAAIAAALLLLVAPPATAEWPQYQHDPRHTGFAPGMTGITATNVSGLSRIWAARVGASPEFDSGVLGPVSVAGGAVYAASDDRQVYALDERDGTRIWPAHSFGNCGITTTPAVDAALVLASWQPCYETSGGAIGGWDRTDGTFNYWTGREGSHSSITISGGTGYLGDGGLSIYHDVPALETVDVASGDSSLLEIPDLRTGIPPAAGPHRIFGVRADAVFALHHGDLSPAWSAPAADLGGSVYSWGSIAVDQGTVFASVLGGSTAAFDARTGKRRWISSIGGRLALDGSSVYVSGYSLAALDRVTGDVRWTRADVTAGTDPAVVPGIVFVGGKRVLALDPATGERLWRSGLPTASTAGYRFVSPSVSGGILYSAIHRRVFAWAVPSGS
jgi:outer membrane protein assembly factor BamB